MIPWVIVVDSLGYIPEDGDKQLNVKIFNLYRRS